MKKADVFQAGLCAVFVAMACFFNAAAYADSATNGGLSKPGDGLKAEDTKGDIPCLDPTAPAGPYTIGVSDVLIIDVLKPETINSQVNVSPDGNISFPYIGSVMVKGRTVDQVQEEVQSRLGSGYMKYPVVSVTLKESHSRKFFVYGEVLKPGAYPVEENTSVLRAISIAGGFTRFGSSSRVKVLRPRKNGPSYEPIKIKITAVMEGDCSEDLIINPGDVVVVSEGVF